MGHEVTHEAIIAAAGAERPVLIAGPTASGKSALALEIAARHGGVIVNADALQVFANWRILTARPDAEESARAPHRLYGHVSHDAPYSVGQWLRDVTPLIGGTERPIIVGGTGLNFAALTDGLAEIPATPDDVRVQANKLPLSALLAGLDSETRASLDIRNRARVQRAYEVQQATGRRILDWQAETPAPLLALGQALPVVVQADPAVLNLRIARRFDAMLAAGVLDEVQSMLPFWNPDHHSAKAIGAADLIACLRGTVTLDQAREAAITATRQYAKRQRTWLRKRMKDWQSLELSSP